MVSLSSSGDGWIKSQTWLHFCHILFPQAPSDVLNSHWKRFICTAEFYQVRSLNLYVYYLRMHYPRRCPRVVCSRAIWKILHIPGASVLTRAAERIRDSVCVDLRLIDLFALAKMQWRQKSSGISVARRDMLTSFPTLLFLALFFFFLFFFFWQNKYAGSNSLVCCCDWRYRR